MATLKAKQRKRIAKKNFAVPKGKGKKSGANSYPVHDKAHARNALARVAQHGTSAEKKAVRRKVAAKYPGIGKGSSTGTKSSSSKRRTGAKKRSGGKKRSR